jgi:predicted DNA binding CopG/RHH family protein
MAESRKRAVSLRVSDADLRKVKKLATRLGARDSDVIRFALKTMLTRLAPLCDQNVRGRGPRWN